MPEFFLELFSEEIPARMQFLAAQRLADAIWPIRFNLDPDSEAPKEELRVFCGPRRIALRVTVGAEKPGKIVEERGPRDTAPEMALRGFLKKHEADRSEVVAEKGYFVLRRKAPPELAFSYIKRTLSQLIVQKIDWPKSMRWGEGGEFSWVRPLRRVTCLLDGEIIPVVLGPVTASNLTEGHRVMSDAPFAVSSAAQWENELLRNYVVASYEERWKLIELGLRERAAEVGATVVQDEYLLNEVVGLVDWPVVHVGKIDETFMNLPPEVRELSMKVNQKYFALRDLDGKPAPYFAFVANLAAPDGGAAIIAGNERVLRARLADARHFWEQDLRFPLNVLLPKLDAITFHAEIGTQRARAVQIAYLAKKVAEHLGADPAAAAQARWAGLLCKADLVTGMVGEFPELQGIMGGYYAEWFSGGWDGPVVGLAIRTHYQPKGPTDAVPAGLVPVSVALADKLNTLGEFFRIGEVPTGSGDPYALRRAALGVIRIILENELCLPLRPFLANDQKLFDFIIERLRVKLRNEGKRYDILDAVLGAGADDDLLRLMQRVEALETMLETEDGQNLLVAYRRAANILKIEDARDGPHRGADLQALAAPEEQQLLEVISDVRHASLEDLAAGRYDQAMTSFARLRQPVDLFFDKITVNAPEPELRLNRLRLLAQLRDTMHRIADFSKIQG